MKFSEMRYERADFDAVAPRYEALIAQVKQAAGYPEARAAYDEIEALDVHVQTMASLTHVRYTINTEDSFYAAEREYYDENGPRFEELSQHCRDALLHSPFRADFEKDFGALMFTNMEMENRTFKPEIIADLQEENKLTTRYEKLLASAQIPFDGQTLTLPQLGPYERSTDRAVRKSAMEARAGYFLENADALDKIFAELVRVRTRIAQTLGYQNFLPLAYDRMSRNSYTPQDVAAFRSGVRSDIVPLAQKIKEAQAQRLGLPRLELHDEPLFFPDGNAAPQGTPEEIFAAGKQMYHELSPETAEFIDFMLEGELLDVLSRKGKAGGGYCTVFSKYKSPFIFANFNGTSDDIDVLTHEAGHAFAFYLARDVYPAALAHPTNESCEVHSMAMEFFTWPWMDRFFGEGTEKYRYFHLAGALTFLPYGAMVDEFQHHIYENPDWTPKQRNDCWLQLERVYRPWLRLEGVPFHSEGRRWQMQAHIYEVPFYYIDYCLAQCTALELWTGTQGDFRAAWEKYLRFVGQCGKQTFSGLLAHAGLRSPFVPGALREAAQTAERWLAENPAL